MEELRTSAQTLASTDPTFRTALLRSPRGTLLGVIEQTSGARYELPKEIKVVALEQPEGIMLVVVPSPDKAAASNTELAKLSLEVLRNPELRASLTISPRETLEAFLGANGSSGASLPEDKIIKVIVEESEECIVVVSPSKSSSTLLVANAELSAEQARDRMMWCTYDHIDSPHFTLNCFMTVDCNWSTVRCQ